MKSENDEVEPAFGERPVLPSSFILFHVMGEIIYSYHHHSSSIFIHTELLHSKSANAPLSNDEFSLLNINHGFGNRVSNICVT